MNLLREVNRPDAEGAKVHGQRVTREIEPMDLDGGTNDPLDEAVDFRAGFIRLS